MSDEERWANRKEGEAAGQYEYDVRNRPVPEKNSECIYPKCGRAAINMYVIQRSDGMMWTEPSSYPLCEDHDDEEVAFDLFQKKIEDEKQDFEN